MRRGIRINSQPRARRGWRLVTRAGNVGRRRRPRSTRSLRSHAGDQGRMTVLTKFAPPLGSVTMSEDAPAGIVIFTLPVASTTTLVGWAAGSQSRPSADGGVGEMVIVGCGMISGRNGKRIAIVHESDFWDAVEDHGVQRPSED